MKPQETNSRILDIKGQEVINFLPENQTKAALVSLNVLQKLASLLPTANLYKIKRSFQASIDNVQTMEEYVEKLRNELEFHESVNLITLYNQHQQNGVEAELNSLETQIAH